MPDDELETGLPATEPGETDAPAIAEATGDTPAIAEATGHDTPQATPAEAPKPDVRAILASMSADELKALVREHPNLKGVVEDETNHRVGRKLETERARIRREVNDEIAERQRREATEREIEETPDDELGRKVKENRRATRARDALAAEVGTAAERAAHQRLQNELLDGLPEEQANAIRQRIWNREITSYKQLAREVHKAEIEAEVARREAEIREELEQKARAQGRQAAPRPDLPTGTPAGRNDDAAFAAEFADGKRNSPQDWARAVKLSGLKY